MGSFYRYVNLTTKGNTGLVAPNLDVVSPVDGQTYNFPAGKLIVYNPLTNKTLDVAGIATAKAVRFGVGHNPKKGLMATEIRHIGGNDIDLCKTMLKVKVQPPVCATPHVIDFEFGCTWTGQDYMFQLDINDWMTRAYYKEGAVGSLLFNLRDELTGCTSCTEEANCDKLACQLADKINNEWLKNYPGTSKLGMLSGKPSHGVWAAKKYTNSVTFTLAATEVEGGCTVGCAVKGLKSIGATDAVTLTFQNAVDPAAPTQTLLEQLGTVVDQINTFLTGKGTAYLKQVNCCEFAIEVNTCMTNVTLTYHDDTTNTGSTSAAFTAFTPSATCLGCNSQGEETMACGVRIFIDPLELPCNCQYPDGNAPDYFGRSATATAWGDGWKETSYRVVVVQNMQVPLGTGYEVQQNEFNQSQGGSGFNYPLGALYSDDRIPLPLAKSRANQASVADCTKMYCIWSIVTVDQVVGSPIARNVQNSQSVSFLNIPRTDETTIAAAQDVLAAMTARGFCSSAEYTCVSFES